MTEQCKNDVNELVETLRRHGRIAAHRRMQALVQERKLKTWEASVLGDKVRETAKQRGVIFR